MKKIFLLYLIAAMMSFAVFAVTWSIAKANVPETDTEPAAALNSEDGYLMRSAVGLFSENDISNAFSNGLFYLCGREQLIECDTQSGVCTDISELGDRLRCISPYGGFIYAVYIEYIAGASMFDEGITRYHIIRIDYNTHEMSTLYTADDGREIRCMSLSLDGEIFFNERDGYEKAHFTPQESYLYSMHEGEKPSLIVQADWYYIDKQRLYITRYNSQSDTEQLYYAPREEPDKLTDTGLTVGSQISDNNGVMFMPTGDSIYYTDEDYDLCCYDINSKQSEHIAGFDGEKRIYYYTVFDGRMFILVREQKPDGFWCYVLYYLDEINTPVRITGDEELNKGKKYWFEYIYSISTFPGNDEFFVIITYDQNMDTKVYTVDKQLHINMLMQSGEWDYDAFEKMKDGMPEVVS